MGTVGAIIQKWQKHKIRLQPKTAREELVNDLKAGGTS